MDTPMVVMTIGVDLPNVGWIMVDPETGVTVRRVICSTGSHTHRTPAGACRLGSIAATTT